MPVWTHGTWTVVPGREDEFILAWQTMAREAKEELGAGQPTLLRDRERPNLFVSFGPWPDDEAVAQFRSSASFKRGVAAIEGLLESFEPRTLDEVPFDG